MELVFPKLTTYQEEVYDWLGDAYKSSKIAVILAPRQVGKTYLIQVELLVMAFSHKCTSIVFEPTKDIARKVYKALTKALDNTNLIKSANAQLLEIEFTNGSEILFRSVESMNRGYTCTGYCILDEGAWLGDDNIFTVLPLVNAANASIILCSSPFTAEGYFYEMFIRGLEGNDPLVKSFNWSKHPDIGLFLSEDKKLLYKQTMSKAKYATEIEGSFLTSQGLLFSHLSECIKDTPIKSGDVFYCGIDFGTGSDEDYTVLSVFNGDGNMVKMYRTNNLSPMQQVEWLSGLIKELNQYGTIHKILAEENSIGRVYIDALKSRLPKGVTLTNWVTTNKSKNDLVTTFQINLENEMVTILDNPILLNELKKYQAEINPKTKTITYNGFKSNDDTVIATMLAFYGYKKHFGKASISFA